MTGRSWSSNGTVMNMLKNNDALHSHFYNLLGKKKWKSFYELSRIEIMHAIIFLAHSKLFHGDYRKILLIQC